MQLLDMISPCIPYAALLRTSVLSYMTHMWMPQHCSAGVGRHLQAAVMLCHVV